MKKLFKVITKHQQESLLGRDLEYIIFARNIKEAIDKVLKVIHKKYYIKKAEFYCEVDEDSDLEEYKKELEEDESI